MRGILRGNLGEGNCGSKIAARQWGVNFWPRGIKMSRKALWEIERSRTPQSAHHPHKNHDEHRQCNPGGGIHFAVLLGSDNSYTTPFEIPFLIRSPLWWRYMVGGPL